LSVDILLIDDSEMHVNTLIKLLQVRGYEAEAVLDPAEALHTIESRRPKLVILDIMMPGIDGLSLLKKIKDTPSTANIPVVIFSGKMFPPEKKKALALGAEKFLIKPMSSADLLEEISPYL
jgi:CheY-like chemotaxis protein